MIEDLKGGRGKCQYCGEFHNNVSYHEEHECKIGQVRRQWKASEEQLRYQGVEDIRKAKYIR